MMSLPWPQHSQYLASDSYTDQKQNTCAFRNLIDFFDNELFKSILKTSLYFFFEIKL
jgi:hypothetical protein